MSTSFSVGLSARAGFATAMILSPAAEMTWTPAAVRSTVSPRLRFSFGFGQHASSEETGDLSLSRPLPYGKFDGALLKINFVASQLMGQDVWTLHNTYSLAGAASWSC